ncbi:hypothetical protein ACVIHI_000071 [Bradyrhizobium sp. USDA 4524]|nr:hypothetical protein [Bradyrhizobium sp. USDA 4538]MCP1899129.1 hypothetical protein [Bradyrhizobium sp. USDA 4537]MCP1986758.1 hypothetical protein [Bradyrhizobium sp. USDA 4539]
MLNEEALTYSRIKVLLRSGDVSGLQLLQIMILGQSD